MKKKIQISLFAFVLLRFIIYIKSHFYCINFDYITPGVSLYQSYYYPLMATLELLTLSFCLVCFAFIIDAFRLTKVIALSMLSIDLITSIIILYGFDFDFYMETIYMIYGIILAISLVDIIRKPILFLVLPFFLLASCLSSRDVQKNRMSESSENKLADNSTLKKDSTSESSLNLNIKKTDEILLINKDQSFTIRETFKPIDNTKSSRYNGNEFVNAEITTEKTFNKKDNVSHEKKSEDISSDQKESANKSEDSKKDIVSESENKKKGEAIKSSRTNFSFWWLVPFAIIIAAFLFFKNKAKIISFF